MSMSMDDEMRVPQACTLPGPEQPLRLAEFEDLFSTALLHQERVWPTRLRWQLDPAAEGTVRDLTGRESECCSFFTFTFTTTGDGLYLDIDVPPAQVTVLDALTQRAAERIRV